jgi:Tol biopolymer transport system component
LLQSPAATTTGSATEAPTAEPASGRIVFARSIGAFTVWLTDPNGANATRVLPGAHECPRWSPNGTAIAMSPHGVFKEVGQPSARYQEFKVADPNLTLGCSIWSPDSKRLAFEGWDETDPTRNGIYTASAVDGSDLRRLTSNPDGGNDVPGDFSPDGRQLFFTRGRLMVVAMDGSDPKPLTDEAGYGVPSLSPDGRTLVAAREGRLQLIAIDGSLIGVIPSRERIWGGPSWSPDGKLIVFSLITRTGSLAIGRVRPDGTGLFKITDSPADEEFPDWAP